jgi:Beta-lactamase
MVTACAAETAASKPSSLQQDVDALVTGGAPGAILLVRDGNRTSHYAGGFADVARKRPMRARDHFKIACLTKSYTATVVLQLVAEGELHLTDTVERWLPGLVPNGGKITIRELLNHTSGIPEYETDARYLKPYLSGNFAYYWPPRKMVALAVSHKPLFPPGKTRISAYFEHQLRDRRSDRRGGHRTHDRRRTEQADLPAPPSARHQLPNQAGSAQPVHARLHGRRQAPGGRRQRAQPVPVARLGCDRLHRRRRRRLLPRPVLQDVCSDPTC